MHIIKLLYFSHNLAGFRLNSFDTVIFEQAIVMAGTSLAPNQVFTFFANNN